MQTHKLRQTCALLYLVGALCWIVNAYFSGWPSGYKLFDAYLLGVTAVLGAFLFQLGAMCQLWESINTSNHEAPALCFKSANSGEQQQLLLSNSKRCLSADAADSCSSGTSYRQWPTTKNSSSSYGWHQAHICVAADGTTSTSSLLLQQQRRMRGSSSISWPGATGYCCSGGDNDPNGQPPSFYASNTDDHVHLPRAGFLDRPALSATLEATGPVSMSNEGRDWNPQGSEPSSRSCSCSLQAAAGAAVAACLCQHSTSDGMSADPAQQCTSTSSNNKRQNSSSKAASKVPTCKHVTSTTLQGSHIPCGHSLQQQHAAVLDQMRDPSNSLPTKADTFSALGNTQPPPPIDSIVMFSSSDSSSRSRADGCTAAAAAATAAVQQHEEGLSYMLRVSSHELHLLGNSPVLGGSPVSAFSIQSAYVEVGGATTGWMWWDWRPGQRSFLAAFVQVVGTTIFLAACICGFPGVLSTDFAAGDWVLWDVFFWAPFLFGSCLFITSALMSLWDQQTLWWQPHTWGLDCWIHLANTVGSIGFWLCSFFGFFAYPAQKYQRWGMAFSCLWGSCCFAVAACLQLRSSCTNERQLEHDNGRLGKTMSC